MLFLNPKGLLTPDRNIKSSVEELKTYFVDAISSSTRSEIFKGYLLYSNDLKSLIKNEPLLQWINGSFVTSTPNPKDIDVVVFLDFQLIQQLGDVLNTFGPKGSMKTYGVDAYIVAVYPEFHSQHRFYEFDKAYWIDKFSKTRRDTYGVKQSKGFLEIIY